MESQGDVNTASSPEDVQPLSRRETQEVDCGVNHSWAACHAVARRMLRYLDNSEALKVDTKELEDQVLAPSDLRVDIDHTARQAEENKFKDCSRSSVDASVARWEEHLRMLTVLERKRLDLSEATEQFSEKQELLATFF